MEKKAIKYAAGSSKRDITMRKGKTQATHKKILKRFFQERKLADVAQRNANSAQTLRIWVRLREKKI